MGCGLYASTAYTWFEFAASMESYETTFKKVSIVKDRKEVNLEYKSLTFQLTLSPDLYERSASRVSFFVTNSRVIF